MDRCGVVGQNGPCVNRPHMVLWFADGDLAVAPRAPGSGRSRIGPPCHGIGEPVEVYELVRPAPAPPTIKARSAIVLDLDRGNVLYQRDAHGRRAPASLLKVATALVALEHLGLDQLVTVPVAIDHLPWNRTPMG